MRFSDPAALPAILSLTRLSFIQHIAERFRQRETLRRLLAADAIVVCFDEATRDQMTAVMVRLGILAHRRRLVLCLDDTFCACARDAAAHERLIEKRLILVARHPADVVLAGGHRTGGAALAGEDDGTRTVPQAAVMPVIQRMNRWAREFGRYRHLLFVRDADLSAQPEGTLLRVLQFLDCPTSTAAIRDAAATLSFDDGAVPADERDRINAIVATWLAPVYGYDSRSDDQGGIAFRDTPG